MTNTIISNDIEETKGIDLSNIEESIENDSTEEETLEVSTDENVKNVAISEETFNNALEKIQTMNFIEISRYVRSITGEIESHKAAKVDAEGILELQKSMRESEDITKAIELADAEFTFENEDVNLFLESYDDTLEKLTKILEAAEEKKKSYDDVKKTTSFITNEMIDIIDKNIERLNNTEDESAKTKRALQYYTAVRNIYTDRTNLSWVIDKVESQKVVMRRLKKSLDKDKNGTVLDSTQKNVTKAFCRIFNVNQLNVFEKYIVKLFENDDTAAFYTQYFLYLVYKYEKEYGKYGNHKYVELLIMDVLEIASDNYDLEGGSEVIDKQLLQLKDAVKSALNLK